jgi:hypothetical protein
MVRGEVDAKFELARLGSEKHPTLPASNVRRRTGVKA